MNCPICGIRGNSGPQMRSRDHSRHDVNQRNHDASLGGLLAESETAEERGPRSNCESRVYRGDRESGKDSCGYQAPPGMFVQPDIY